MSRLRHGCSYKGKWTRAYSSWASMIQRCQNPKSSRFSSHGGRGIKVCERWKLFDNFLEDMGEPPSSKHSIERENNDGNYEPGNCRWATAKEQARNTRRNKLVTVGGVVRCIAEWAEISGINVRSIHSRLEDGWPEDIAVTKKTRKIKPYGEWKSSCLERGEKMVVK